MEVINTDFCSKMESITWLLLTKQLVTCLQNKQVPKKPKEVISFLEDLWAIFGLSTIQSLTMDRGTFKMILENLGVTHKTYSPYQPQKKSSARG